MKNQNTNLILAILFNSLFVGAFLFIAVAIVPFWQSITDSEIVIWFNNNFEKFPMLMIPLNLLTFVTISLSMYHNRKQPSTKKIWLIALIFIFLCSITYPVFFDGTNKAILASTDQNDHIKTLIDQWEIWHYVRTGFAMLSLLSLLMISLKKN